MNGIVISTRVSYTVDVDKRMLVRKTEIRKRVIVKTIMLRPLKKYLFLAMGTSNGVSYALAYPGEGHWAIARCLKIYCPVIF